MKFLYIYVLILCVYLCKNLYCRQKCILITMKKCMFPSSLCMRNTLETLKISFSFSFYRQNIVFTIEFLKLLNLHVFGGVYTQESWQNIVFIIEFLKLLNLHVFGGVYTQESWQNIVFTIEFLKILNLHVFGGFTHKKVCIVTSNY